MMNRLAVLAVTVIAALGAISMPAQAAGLPLVISATVDYTQKTLKITGQNFGSNPTITVNSLTFPTMSSASNQIVGNFPSGKPPSSFAPGTYFLTLRFGDQLPSVFAVDIGAIGPPGATGATGADGGQGPIGPAGGQGQKGDKGDKGDPGSGGGGLICATPPDIYLFTAGNGTQTCQPRYVDNGDGTVTDNQTGLMWEQKLSSADARCVDPSQSSRDVRCVQNTFTWSSPSDTDQNGTLYGDFLPQLNDMVAGLPRPMTNCFAGHCDWRIPTFGELRSILLLGYPHCIFGSSSCIDSAFGPTQTFFYWSSTSAWAIHFGDGQMGPGAQGNQQYARAVRGGH